MKVVPFTIEIYGGLGRVDGRLRVDLDSLILDYQAKDEVFGVIKGRPRQVRITMKDLQDVEFVRRRLRKSLIVVELSDLHLAQRIPGAKLGRIELSIAKEFRDDAQRATQRLQRYLSEHRLLSDDRTLTEADVDLLFGDDE